MRKLFIFIIIGMVILVSLFLVTDFGGIVECWNAGGNWDFAINVCILE